MMSDSYVFYTQQFYAFMVYYDDGRHRVVGIELCNVKKNLIIPVGFVENVIEVVVRRVYRFFPYTHSLHLYLF